MNPARAFGPELVHSVWESYTWIYYAGPAVGAVVAAVLYELLYLQPKMRLPLPGRPGSGSTSPARATSRPRKVLDMESFRTADGRALSYRREGSGPLFVCHPGGPGFSSRYFADMTGLGERFTLVMLNPRGSEGSDPPEDVRAYRTEDYVSDLDELREHLGLERMLLLGHSHGGVVAAAYAATHPDRVEKLVLASTLARFAEEHDRAMRDGMERRSGEPWYEDAREALEREEAGDFEDDEELRELAKREFPFYFAHFGDAGARLPRLAR